MEMIATGLEIIKLPITEFENKSIIHMDLLWILVGQSKSIEYGFSTNLTVFQYFRPECVVKFSSFNLYNPLTYLYSIL